MNLGAHMSIAGGVHLALERGKQTGCNVVQIFTKNQTRWSSPPLKEDTAEKFLRLKENFFSVFAHASYLINLASPDIDLSLKSIDALIDEMARCGKLGITMLVVHPGSYTTGTETEGIRRIAESLIEVYDRSENQEVSILLETTAGQGTSIGYKFEHLRDILAETEKYSCKIGICIDTCHIFAAGYNFSDLSLYNRLTDKFNNIVGLTKLRAVHLNDSKKTCGSRIDRHEHIGKGMIGLNGFKHLLTDSRLRNIPMCLETPKGKDMHEDAVNLAVLRSLRPEPEPER